VQTRSVASAVSARGVIVAFTRVLRAVSLTLPTLGRLPLDRASADAVASEYARPRAVVVMRIDRVAIGYERRCD
jgi:hypothetical protein